MTYANVEPMAKPSRIRDHDRATEKKRRRFKKHNIDSGKSSFLESGLRKIEGGKNEGK